MLLSADSADECTLSQCAGASLEAEGFEIMAGGSGLQDGALDDAAASRYAECAFSHSYGATCLISANIDICLGPSFVCKIGVPNHSGRVW